MTGIIYIDYKKNAFGINKKMIPMLCILVPKKKNMDIVGSQVTHTSQASKSGEGLEKKQNAVQGRTEISKNDEFHSIPFFYPFSPSLQI